MNSALRPHCKTQIPVERKWQRERQTWWTVQDWDPIAKHKWTVERKWKEKDWFEDRQLKARAAIEVFLQKYQPTDDDSCGAYEIQPKQTFKPKPDDWFEDRWLKARAATKAFLQKYQSIEDFLWLVHHLLSCTGFFDPVV